MATTDGSSASNLSMLDMSDEFRIVQTRKGCFQEMCGCEANSEFLFVVGDTQQGIIEEQSSCCIRFCCANLRPWTTKMALGTDINAPTFLSFERPFRCKHGNCKCCCYQEVMATDGAGASHGGVREKCWYCVPTFELYDPSDVPEYVLHMPTCCGGMCVNCCAQGCCNCRIPFFFYKPDADEDDKAMMSTKSTPVPNMPGAPHAQICKVWSGLTTELFTDADTFECKCPDNSDSSAKARIIASTLLLNQLFFESDNKDQETVSI